MSFYQVSILTPSKAIIKDFQAEQVIVPTGRGEMNLLPEHTHLITKLDIGVLKLKGATEQTYVINSGVCKVLNKEVKILASTCEVAENINLEQAQKDKKLSFEKLAGKEHLSDSEFNNYQRLFLLSEARIKVAKG